MNTYLKIGTENIANFCSAVNVGEPMVHYQKFVTMSHLTFFSAFIMLFFVHTRVMAANFGVKLKP